MRLADPRLWLGVLALGAVAVAVQLESERTSPGPLTPVHAREPDLEGPDGCDRCHGSWRASMDAACTECHEAIGEQLSTGTDFHGAGALERCGRCHVEHHGEALPLAGAHAFELAGVPDRAGFRHDFVAFVLAGAHDGLGCERCHENADVELPARDTTRFGGLSQRCATCHDDPHEGRLSDDCARCHGQVHPFEELANFVHPASFPLAGAHGGLACGACHAKDSAFSVEALAGPRAPGDGPKPGPRACEACHESSHDARFLADVAGRLETTPAASCERCHPVVSDGFSAGTLELEPELHAATGFALVGVHALACEECHEPRSSGLDFAARYPGRRASDCAACHEDPHAGQFTLANGSPQACTACHETEHWVPSTIDAAAHARPFVPGRPGFPLDGAHARAACDACHAQEPGTPQTFRGAPRACAACHEDAHEAAFDAFVAALPDRPAGGACAACHDTTSFADVAGRFGAARHGPATGFTLAGAHARAECEACHAPAAAPDALGRRFGRAAERFGQPVRACATCHEDVHRGAFGALDCARCHGEESFRDLREPFDHGAWTGFVLDGAHATEDCQSCHGTADPLRDGRSLGRVADLFRGPPEQCATCHRDPHGGVFDRFGVARLTESGQGCARCHTTASFVEGARADFDHGGFTRFALEGRHAEVRCEDCHAPEPAPGRQLGRAAGQRCEDCHEDPHGGQFTLGVARDCAQCHDAASFTDLQRFDHDRDSRFALDAQHAPLDCTACHRPWPMADGRVVVRYRPLGTTCVECHGFSGKGRR